MSPTSEDRYPIVHSTFERTITVDGCEFKVAGLERDWDPLPGYEGPYGRVFEARVTPSGVRVWESSLDGCIEHAERTIRRYAAVEGVTVAELHARDSRGDDS